MVGSGSYWDNISTERCRSSKYEEQNCLYWITWRTITIEGCTQCLAIYLRWNIGAATLKKQLNEVPSSLSDFLEKHLGYFLYSFRLSTQKWRRFDANLYVKLT